MMAAVGPMLAVLLAVLLVLLLHRLACWRYRLPAIRLADDAPPLPQAAPMVFPGSAAALPGASGIYLLDDPRQAFAARVLLARRAQVSLDLQYYIWHNDTAGRLLLNEVREAADRGVRVRLLLDDNGIPGLDPLLSALASHANISVRLFNPFVVRKPKAIGYLLDFRRLNRRMHNKSFIADGCATILGGRNIGNEYMGASEKALFADLDVFATGAVVADVAADFERYWQSEPAWPAAQILPAADPDGLARFRQAHAELVQSPQARDYVQAVTDGAAHQLLAGGLALEWTQATLLSDDPAKALGRAVEAQMLGPKLTAVIGMPASELAVVSAYFVLTAADVADFAEMAAAGVRVGVMTNSLQSNDVALVHAGYAPTRKPLLRAGVRLWEMKGDDPLARARLHFRRRKGTEKRGTIFRSSGSALHAKTFAVDSRRLFVGSFNFDPRSARLNTEMGLVIDSPALAARLQAVFDSGMSETAYEVRLRGGRLVWLEQTAGGEIVHRHEPGTGPGQRLVIALLGRLPIRWML
jgi:putative cardiolipin synthase